jgi:RNA polymerase sigma-70 factor (ECF subfamily)
MGESSEFERLVLASLDSLYGYALARTWREEEAEDLLQESLARAFERFRSFDQSLSFKAWMFTVIRNTHIDRLRKRTVREGLDGAMSQVNGADAAAVAESPLYAIPLDPEAVLARRESLERVREAIRHLPGDMREVVELRDIEGLSYLEIATIVNRPIGTVMSRLYRGRNLLRAWLVEEAPGEKGAGSRRGL